MALINDTDAAGNSVVQVTKIVENAHYIHPTFAMGVWPPIYPDGSKPYGDPLVHMFYVDTNNHAHWYRMNPAVSQHSWQHVQDFGYMTGILIYRGIVTMWNPLFARAYNFFGGSELVFPDGSNGPTSSGANPAGNNLMTNQPFSRNGEHFWWAYDSPGGVNAFNQPITINDAFSTYLFSWWKQTSTFEDSQLFSPPGPVLPGNPTGAAGGPHVNAFLGPVNYGGQPGIGALVADNYDASLGYGGNVPCVIQTPQIQQDLPTTVGGTFPPPRLVIPGPKFIPKRNDPELGLVDTPFFPATYGPGVAYRSFQTFTDFSGSSGGATTFSYYAGTTFLTSRGSFHPGYTLAGSYAIEKGDPEVWDQGLFGPESVVTSSLYNGRVFIWGIDRAGVIGSNYLGSTISGGAEIQNDGTRTRFGKCRLVGTTGYSISGSFAPPIMPLVGETASLGFWGPIYNGQPNTGCIYWLTDSQPKARDTFGRIVPLDKAPADPPLIFSQVDIPLPPTTTPLGVSSSNNTLPHFNVQQLQAACSDPNLLPNPNHSEGCSPVLRAIFEMSGLPYAVIREVSNDQQESGHQGGNAIDITGPTPPLTGDSISISDVADQEMVELCVFIKSVPELFAVAVRVNEENDSESLYVLDGKIVTKSAFGTRLKKDTTNYIHVASSGSRIRAALSDPGVQAAIGAGPATASLVGGKVVIRNVFQLGQFGYRYVYVNQDQLVNTGKGVQGLNVSKDNPKIVHFW